MKAFIFITLLIFVNCDEQNEVIIQNSFNNEDTSKENKSHVEHKEPIPFDLDIESHGILSDSCNRTDLSPRIVGGVAADPGMFPYQIALLIYLDKSVRYYFCGGVLIHPCFILSAAHCCDSAIKFRVILGATNWRLNESTQIRVNTTFKIVHPQWNNETLENDICLIMLPECVNSTVADYIKPIKIWNKTKNDAIGLHATISGWGRTTDNSFLISNELRYISIPVIPTCGICQATYNLVYNGNICTSSDNGMSPCNGDSGGPMVVTDDDGEDCLIGIVSYGHVKGCQRGYPAVQTYVPCYKTWINKVINYILDDDHECSGNCV